jgi:NAD(P)-dependent dehydrogenase (short-subunit alcohol dehydrogenase family)
VVVHGRNASHGAAVVDAITAEGGHARFAAADLGDPAGSGDLVRQAGPVDVLVNNTGQVGLPNAAALGATTPMSRAVQPGEIAEVIAFFASPKASYITGAVIAADGGRTAV